MANGTKSTKAVKAPAVKQTPLCACGCGKRTSGVNFRQGHDQRLRGQMARGETLKSESKKFLADHPDFGRYAPSRKPTGNGKVKGAVKQAVKPMPKTSKKLRRPSQEPETVEVE